MIVTKALKNDGFVIYDCSDMNKVAVAVVSKNGDRKATIRNPPGNASRFLVAIEDRRFFSHIGLDGRAIMRALWMNFKSNRITQGGSTISQQLARNLLRSFRRTVSRKLVESIYAICLEACYTKKRLLILYFNNVYWGKNIYGIRAASLSYLGKEPQELTEHELLALLVLLRGPNRYLRNTELAKERMDRLAELLLTQKSISLDTFQKFKINKPEYIYRPLEVIPPAIIPYIKQKVQPEKCIIESTLVHSLQLLARNFVTSCKNATSIIVLRNGKVAAMASVYGMEHCFHFKTNVGSTLKPFMHYYFNREGQTELDEELYYSANKPFIVAAENAGMEKVLDFLGISLHLERKYIVPASILGATVCGISIYDLALAYHRFFFLSTDALIDRTKRVLEKIACAKLQAALKGMKLKTGTTNDDKEKLAVVMHNEFVFAVLRENNPTDNTSKEGDFLQAINRYLIRPLAKYFEPKPYQWMK